MAEDNAKAPVDSFAYQLLGRLQHDCEHFLGAGGRCTKRLWAQDEAAQIAKMRELYAVVPVAPVWLSLEQIEHYGAQMLGPQPAVALVMPGASRGSML